MQVFALRLEKILNAPTLAPARQAARRFAQTKDWGKDRETAMAARVDPDSIAAMTALFDLPQAAPEPAANSLYAPVAGYGYAFDAGREAAFVAGQPLTLTREADNPADPLAIRIEWAGHKIGYVPRPDNAHFALQMDAGQVFAARIGDLVPQAPMWKRLWFRIDPLGADRHLRGGARQQASPSAPKPSDSCAAVTPSANSPMPAMSPPCLSRATD